MPTREVPDVDLSADRVAEKIVLAEPDTDREYLDALAFGEEMVTIRLERGREKNAPKLLDFYVNGVVKWVPVGQPVTLQRKYVEVIARAQPYAVNTEVDEEGPDGPVNRVTRSASAMFPFSVIRDPNPCGFDWLTKVMQSA